MNSCFKFLSCLLLGHSFLHVCVVCMCGHTCVERTEDSMNDVHLRVPHFDLEITDHISRI